MRERNSFTYLFAVTIVYAVLLSAVALGQIRIQKSIRINPGISTDDAPPTRLHYNGYLHDLYVEFTITPADPNFQPLLWLWMRPEWTDDYGLIIPGQMDACEEYRPQLNTYVEEYLGQGYFAVAPEHGGGNPTNYPYTLSARAFVDGMKIHVLGMPGDSLICDRPDFDVYYVDSLVCHSFWNVCWEFYIFNLSTFDKPLSETITQGKVNEIRFDGEVIDHRVSTPPPYWCPMVDSVNVTITKGDKYAHLCTETDTASQMTILSCQETVYLEVDRDVPDTVDQYCVVQTSTRNFARTDTVYYLPHDTLFVTCEPKQLYTGDTAIIHMHQRVDGVVDTNEYFQSREIGILGNDCYGTLLDEWGDTATYFQNVTGQLQFIAAQDIDADSVCAKIRVGFAPSLPMCSVVPMGTVPNRSVPMGIVSKGPVPLGALHSGPVLLGKKGKNPTLAFSGKKKYRQIMNELFKQETKNTFTEGTKPKDAAIVKSVKQVKRARPESLIKKSGKIKDIQFLYTQAGSDSIMIKGKNILLGQTKYYWAIQDPDDDSKLIIQESETDPSQSIPPGIVDVNFSVMKNANDDKLGVYYEYKNDKGYDLGRNWFIRIIGRYWSPDKTYKVHLYADALDRTRSGDMAIEVKKSNSLGNTNFAKARNHGIDIAGNPYSVDSICILFGGRYGFPPQNIKSQYQSESVFDTDLQTYMPSYRYEPWTAEFWSGVQALKNNSNFWVTNQSMGDGDAVPNHQDLRYMIYVNTPHSVWYFIEQYSTIVYNNSPTGYCLFGCYHPNSGRLTFTYDRPTGQYNIIHKRIYKQLHLNNNIENLQANLIVRNQFIQYMSNQYFSGLNNRIAQSRIASSYGPIQLMYTRALELIQRYPVGSHDRPENLNLLDTFFPFAMINYVELLREQVGDINSNDWDDGFEETMRRVYHGWNRKSGYDTGVINNTKNYLPIQ